MFNSTRLTIMKKSIFAVMMLLSLTSMAKERFGIIAGAAFNSLSFDIENYTSKTKAGFCVGVTLESMIGTKGIGFDISAMYSNRSIDIALERESIRGTLYSEGTKSFLEIPINFRYKFSIPSANRIVRPFVFTGPGFHIMLNNKPYVDTFYINEDGSRSYNTSNHVPQFNGAWNFDWNVGVGVELFEHAQISFRYCRDLSKSIHTYGLGGIQEKMSFNTIYIQAAWLF